MRKRVAVVLSLALVLSMCIGTMTGVCEGEKQVIDFWYLWAGKEEAALKQIIEDYNAQSDKYVIKASMCDIAKQIAGMASKNGPDITDIVDNSVANLASKGIVRPLDDYAGTEPEMMADFLPAALRQCEYDDKLYGLPINCMSSMIYYNKQVFADAGIEKLPETMEEFKKLIFDLTVVDENGKIIQTGWPWTGSLDYKGLVQLNGGHFYNEDMTEVTPDDPVMIEMLNMAREYVEKFGVENIRKFNASLGNWISPQDSFFVGKQVMRSDGWYLSKYFEPTGHGDMEWGVFPLPTNEENKGAGLISTSIFVVPTTGDNPEGAWDFLKYLMQPENMAWLMNEFGNEPARYSAAEQPVFVDQPAFKDFFALSSSSNTLTFPGHAIESEYVQTIGAAVDEVLALKATPEEAMKSVKDKMQPVLDKSNK